MNAAATQQKIAEALARLEPLTFAECGELLLELVAAQAEVGDRFNRVAPADGHRPDGAERLKALRTGTADDVRALDQEFEQVRILADQLKAQRDEINARRTAARQREAAANLPKLHQALIDTITEAEAARSSLSAALAITRETVQAINQARGTIRQGGKEPGAGASLKTLRRLQELQPLFSADLATAGWAGRADAGWWVNLLGCAVRQEVYLTACEKAPGVDFSDCETDAEIMRRALSAVHGEAAAEGLPDEEVAMRFGAMGFPNERRYAA